MAVPRSCSSVEHALVLTGGVDRPATLGRAVVTFCGEGLIAMDQGRVVIRKLEELEKLADCVVFC